MTKFQRDLWYNINIKNILQWCFPGCRRALRNSRALCRRQNSTPTHTWATHTLNQTRNIFIQTFGCIQVKNSPPSRLPLVIVRTICDNGLTILRKKKREYLPLEVTDGHRVGASADQKLVGTRQRMDKVWTKWTGASPATDIIEILFNGCK
jgi:hypothetical protein